MRYALILAGGSGTRLWPMSRAGMPKQLIPFIGGRSLLQESDGRLEGLVPVERRYVCAAEKHRAMIERELPRWTSRQVLGEPCGRDTLAAIGFSSAVIAAADPDAVIAVFTSDHLIKPLSDFQRVVASGYDLAERHPNSLVTFGVAPHAPATAYGYLELGERFNDDAWVVRRFKEKPDPETACAYFRAGRRRYLWNSGMFVWRAATLLECIRRYEPVVFDGVIRIAEAWPGEDREPVLRSVYETIKKTSVDYGVMERASRDPWLKVLTLPMFVEWLDVGSWPAFGATCPVDDAMNAVSAERTILHDSSQTLVVSSEPGHLIATIGCNDLIIVHTPDATLVCRRDRAEDLKELHRAVENRYGKTYL